MLAERLVKTTCRIKMRGCRCSPVRSGRAGLLIRRRKSGNDNKKRGHKASMRVVLRLSLQSEDDPLKSGPALAGPAGPRTPPLYAAFSWRE